MGFRAGVDKCGKSRPHRDSMAGPSSPYAAAVPAKLPGPLSLRFPQQKLQFLRECNLLSREKTSVSWRYYDKCAYYCPIPIIILQLLNITNTLK
jgi:hypothetical protein